MTVRVPARKVEPGDIIVRPRPHNVGGGHVRGEVKSTVPPARAGELVEITGDGWSWALPPQQAVERVGHRST
jgi:hypothetical protein